MSAEEKDNPAIDEGPHARPPSGHLTPGQTSSDTSDKEHQNDVPEENVQGHPQANVERPHSLAGEALFVAVLCSSQLLTQAGLAISIMPQHIIARSFGIENQPGEVSWFSAGYSLTVGTFILIAGRLGDVFGHKGFFVGGFAWFGLWSAIAGFAVYSGPIFFAFCRAMQGIGPALLLPNCIAIISRCYEPGLRQNMVFCLFGATAPTGFLVGAVFSSLLSQMAWWPWAYWVMCFACLLLALLGIFVIPATPPSPSSPEHEKSSVWQRVDILGSVTGVAALVLFNFAWNQGPVVGWPTPYTYITMIIGVAIFVVFILIEKRVRHPLIPFGVLEIDSLFTLACISAGWSSFGIFVYYMCNLLMVLRDQTPLYTSAQFVAIAISGLLAAVTTGLILSHFRASTVMVISMSAFLIAGIIIATVPVHQTYWAQTFVAIIILPWGMDMSFPAATIVLSRAMPRQHQGLAASLVNTFVNYSISIGLGFAGTVDSQVSNKGKDILRGYRGAFYMGVGLSGLGVVLALVFCFVERRWRKASEKIPQETNQTTVGNV
ncbi:Drug resistance protein YOR378W-like 3 [Colletotrichum truncatum]|uniref:Drug resistance protein YOR378W-like 3 n=1 Tax=Colletotrichum truncatum TaxID=5467 RepID=A0ACC3YDV3_COLTU|nr:Drug resistance protein YOR378W-like 3 [Colletotrichum truncatum]KAF6791077.1 Drug resistance protein YOR378W-like 3 [Colletotrichum truncatum]